MSPLWIGLAGVCSDGWLLVCGSDFGGSQECGYFGKMLWMTIFCVFSILIKGWKNVFSRWTLSFFTQHTQMGFPWLSPLLLSVGSLFIYKFERLQTTWHKARFWLTSKVSLFFWLDKILLFSGILFFFFFYFLFLFYSGNYAWSLVTITRPWTSELPFHSSCAAFSFSSTSFFFMCELSSHWLREKKRYGIFRGESKCFPLIWIFFNILISHLETPQIH